MTVLLVDLATLRFHRRGDAVLVLTATGEELAALEAAPADPRQAAAMALEAALATARVWRGTQPCQLALYNPHTAQAAFGAFPHGRVLGCGAPVALPDEGRVGEWDGATLVLADGTQLTEVTPLALTELLR